MPSIEKLSCRHAGNMSDWAVSQITANLTNLRSLKLEGAYIISVNSARSLVKCAGLTALDVSFSEMRLEGATRLANGLGSTLVSLDISNSDVGDDGARVLASKLSNVRDLNIGGNDVSVAGAEAIAPLLHRLEALGVGDNKMGDKVRAAAACVCVCVEPELENIVRSDDG